MYLILLPPTAEPISLTEAKKHLKIDSDITEDDTLISGLITAAREWAEEYTGHSLVYTRHQRSLNSFHSASKGMGRIELAHAPLRKVVSVKYDDTDGNETTFSDYVEDYIATPGAIVLDKDESWPDIDEQYVNEVRIEYDSGFLIPFTADAGTDVITVARHPFVNGDYFTLSNSGGALPAGLSAVTSYFVINATATTFQLSLTSGGGAIDITDTGTGTHFIGTIPSRFRTAMLYQIGQMYEMRVDYVKEKMDASEKLLYPFRLNFNV